MALVLDDDEQMLVDALRTLLARSSPVSAFRALRDEGDPKRFAPALWTELVESGFAMPQISADDGGTGMSYTAAGLVAEELGRTLAATPFLSTSVAAELLLASGSAALKQAHLPGLVDGSRLMAFALEEGGRHDPDSLALGVRRDGNGIVLDGTKRFVIDGSAADAFIVAGRTEDGPILLVVEASAPGVAVTPLTLIDSRNAADLQFDGVRVDADQVLADGERAAGAIARALDLGRIVLASELIGLATEAFERTIAYLKEREQFGAKIGSFQALQHRAARMFVGLDLARGTVLKGLRAFDAADAGASALVSLGKAAATKVAREIMNEAVQMHGGNGVTDEFDIGLFFKRARVAGETFGDDYFHRERLARIAWNV